MGQPEPTTHNVFVTRVFDAPLAQVWHAWSDGAHVQTWWGPNGFTCPLCNMDFREGGKTLVAMRAPQEMGGFDMYNTWSYTKIVPHQRIEFTHNFSDAGGSKLDPAALGMVGIPPDVPHVITLRALDNHKTELTVTEYGFATAEVAALSKSGLDECLDKMAASFHLNRALCSVANISLRRQTLLWVAAVLTARPIFATEQSSQIKAV